MRRARPAVADNDRGDLEGPLTVRDARNFDRGWGRPVRSGVIRFRRSRRSSRLAEPALRRHFGSEILEHLVTAARTFPVTARVDLQLALEKLLTERHPTTLLGVHAQHSYETLSIATLLSTQGYPVVIAPLQHDEIDVGESMPARCMRQGLWLGRASDLPFAVLLSPALRYGQPEGMQLEIAVPAGEAGANCSRRLLDDVEALIRSTASYRGKVLSLEVEPNYSGKVGSVRVHKLRAVRRAEVVLPATTVELLNRNVIEFIKHRDELKKLGLPVKKGLLFYGPPGTGKTHTIHYLASQLPDHTTLLITAEQVGLLDAYFQLARFLQPAIIVIEDVDLIARAREDARSACEESLLNKLLNEMDGLREDAALLFVLTTNRPDQLESALASRPGRIDQAIEFPLPDAQGRRRLVELYSGGVGLSQGVIDLIVTKTERASAAFIKELMRRSAQFYLEDGVDGRLTAVHVNRALEEMLFRGGTLNVRLLGGAAIEG